MPTIEEIDRYIMQVNRGVASQPLSDLILGKNILSSKTALLASFKSTPPAAEMRTSYLLFI